MSNSSKRHQYASLGTSCKYRVGKVIGEGACGSVHALEVLTAKGSSQYTEDPAYVVKLASLPANANGAKKKRKKTVQERNADTLFHEYSLYRNVLHHLRGKSLPDLPMSSGVPVYGENSEHCFRYLVMERMASPVDVASVLLSMDRHAGKGAFGKMCAMMLSHLERLHEANLVFIDVKPENFMFAHSKSFEKKGPSPSDIRLIDLGIVESFMDRAKHGHRDDAGGGMVGTPAFVSLNIHESRTPSRRDDIESLGYVVCKLLLLKNISAKDASLPWEKASSDDAVFKRKKICRDDISSELYFNMNEKDQKTMFQYFDICGKLGYDAKPNYEQMKKLLQNLVGSSDSITGKCKTTTKRKASRSPKEPQTPVEPTRIRGTIKEPNSALLMKKRGMKKSAVINIESDSDEDSFKTALVRVDSQSTEKENVVMNSQDRPVAKLVVMDGPHEGQSLDILKSYDEIIIGRNPKTKSKRSKNGSTFYWTLNEDASISSSHASFRLIVSPYSNSAVSFAVTDLDSTNGTFINERQVYRAKTIFAGERVTVGMTTIYVKRG